jgi:hypothetical protein
MSLVHHFVAIFETSSDVCFDCICLPKLADAPRLFPDVKVLWRILLPMQAETPIGQWKTYAEAKEAIEFMPLKDLEVWSGRPKPELLPFSGWAIPVGLVLFFIFSGNPLFQILALLVSVYGVVAVVVNSGKAKDYKSDLYRRWVQDKALEESENEKVQV